MKFHFFDTFLDFFPKFFLKVKITFFANFEAKHTGNGSKKKNMYLAMELLEEPSKGCLFFFKKVKFVVPYCIVGLIVF
jgi:hypothetical protein